MEWFEALLLGLVQGLTEFLPVSSSGHLMIGKELLGISVKEEAETTFEVLVHCATVLSTIVVFRKELINLFLGGLKFKMNEETKYLLMIGVSMLPVMVIGLFFKDKVESLFSSGLMVVGICLLVTSLLLTMTDLVKFKQRKDMGYLSAFIIGLAQAVAVLPGLSRSGATISTGLLLGVKKELVAKFSFLMVLIPILGETFLNIMGGDFSPATSGISTTSMIIGFVSAFVFGFLSCKIMIALVSRSRLIYFAIYCCILGSIVLISL